MSIRIAIGTEPKTMIFCKVLEFSIRRRTKTNVEFVRMIDIPHFEYPTNLRVGTGFSLRRWLIPSYFNWEGFAIYMDADQLVLGDVEELWGKRDCPHKNIEACPDPVIWCSFQPDKFNSKPWPQTSVMVIDCAKAKDFFGFHKDKMIAHLSGRPEEYANFMHATWLKGGVGEFGAEWNHLNVLKPGKTRLLHYTKEPDQPTYKPDHPFAQIWQSELRKALEDGYVTRADLEEGLARWGKKEDWRQTNGLHPYYKKFLSYAR